MSFLMKFLLPPTACIPYVLEVPRTLLQQRKYLTTFFKLTELGRPLGLYMLTSIALSTTSIFLLLL
jgi:hypothetical protein